MSPTMKKTYDIIVVGGGHAGIEASLAAARMGMDTLLVTMSADTIGRMSCNPAIGGQAKGHLVRELDALGGEMGKVIDSAGLHFKMLNKSKGPAVWSPRAQADKYLYEEIASTACKNQRNLDIREGIATGLAVENGAVTSVTVDNEAIGCKKLILTCGTFLNGKIHIGLKNYMSGRSGEPAAVGLTETLKSLGFNTGRLKTGTPPRVDADSVKWERTEVQKPDNPPEAFSFQTKTISAEQIDMYITYTNEQTHEWLRTGLDQSPMYTGAIDAVGPRYCPSIEDKIMRFAHRDRHQIFLEREGYNTNEIYVNGFSTSLPEEAQVKAIKTIPGLEDANVIKLGYAIEYDYFEPYQLDYTMQTKTVGGLYFAGQICGTSGYEEAAVQGFIAGVNAVRSLRDEAPFVLDRTEAYIGVLIDDLINKSTKEPYRMFTSSAEFRLLLRQDNADLRLMKYGKELGLINDVTFEASNQKATAIDELFALIEKEKVRKEVFEEFKPEGVRSIEHSETVLTLLKRPELSLSHFKHVEELSEFPEKVRQHVEFEVKYEGYIARQMSEVKKFKRNESKRIPDTINYDDVIALSNEGREKLKTFQPKSFGHASRISGLRPSDLNVLLVYLEKLSAKSA